MKNFAQKLKIVFIPMLLVAAGFVALYCWLCYRLTINPGPLHIKEDATGFWLPIFLSGPLIFFILYKRAAVLKKSPRLAYSTGVIILILLWAIVATSTIFTYSYIAATAGKLVQAETADEVLRQPKEKYFNIKGYYIDKGHAGIYYRKTTVASKYNTHINYYVYIVAPLLNPGYDAVPNTPKLWLGRKYTDVDAGMTLEEFSDSSWAKFYRDTGSIAFFTRQAFSADYDYLKAALPGKMVDTSAEVIILRPAYTSFNNRDDTNPWLPAGFLSSGMLLLFIIVAFSKLNEETLNEQGTPLNGEGWLFTWQNLIAITNGNVAFYVLMFLVVGGFAVMLLGGAGIAPGGNNLIKWGANYAPLTFKGQWWRLFTYSFVDSQLITLIYLVFLLWVACNALKNYLGATWIVVAYLISGAGGGIASAWFMPQYYSCGIVSPTYGLLGVFAILCIKRLTQGGDISSWLPWPLLTVISLGLSAVMQFNYPGHIGGFLTGLVLGIIFWNRFQPEVVTD